MATLVEDELGEAFVHFRQVRPSFITTAPTSEKVWCDEISTHVKETCHEILELALDRAVAELSLEYGKTPKSWR